MCHGEDGFAKFRGKFCTGCAEHLPEIAFTAIDPGLIGLAFDLFRQHQRGSGTVNTDGARQICLTDPGGDILKGSPVMVTALVPLGQALHRIGAGQKHQQNGNHEYCKDEQHQDSGHVAFFHGQNLVIFPEP